MYLLTLACALYAYAGDGPEEDKLAALEQQVTELEAAAVQQAANDLAICAALGLTDCEAPVIDVEPPFPEAALPAIEDATALAGAPVDADSNAVTVVEPSTPLVTYTAGVTVSP